MLIHKAGSTLIHRALIRHVDEPRNPTAVDEALSICGLRVDANTHKHTVCSGTAGVASLQMAGAAHTLPVVIQYVLYNSGEQQALSRCRKQRHTDPVIHSRLLTHDRSPCLRPFLHRTLNHTSQAASYEDRIPVSQSWLWNQVASQWDAISLSVRQAYSCAVSHAAVQVTGAACAASRPARHLFTHRNYAKCKKSASQDGWRGGFWRNGLFCGFHTDTEHAERSVFVSTSLCACVTSGVWAHSNIVMM